MVPSLLPPSPDIDNLVQKFDSLSISSEFDSLAGRNRATSFQGLSITPRCPVHTPISVPLVGRKPMMVDDIFTSHASSSVTPSSNTNTLSLSSRLLSTRGSTRGLIL